jgi:hypothetical protein
MDLGYEGGVSPRGVVVFGRLCRRLKTKLRSGPASTIQPNNLSLQAVR